MNGKTAQKKNWRSIQSIVSRQFLLKHPQVRENLQRKEIVHGSRHYTKEEEKFW